MITLNITQEEVDQYLKLLSDRIDQMENKLEENPSKLMQMHLEDNINIAVGKRLGVEWLLTKKIEKKG